ncbi:MAG: BCCT family transporter [Clostridiales bacterium]|jgi:BCCT family betaine/carnitine transporter|nr:BCCT family transporter [Clostridiales bacterium]
MKERMKNSGIDWVSVIVPPVVILALGAIFIALPESEGFLSRIGDFFRDDFGLYYILLGVLIFGATIYMAFSKIGKIRLGKTDKPAFSNFTWGALIFTSTMAADIIFFSLSEWAMYYNEPRVNELGDPILWSATFPLFHWGPIAWSFYIVLAISFGYMLHVKKGTKQKFSEATRALFGKRVDGPLGKVIDLLAIFALLAGTATTFSVATPLIAAALGSVFGIGTGTAFTIIILLMVAVIYTIALLTGVKGISRLAKISVYFFFAFLIYVLVLGGEGRFILETGISALGNLGQNFLGLATWTDPMRNDSFPQNWTTFYWAYWMAWCVATPFFIGMVSKGRTIRNTVLGGYAWGLAGTFTSFIILGNYGLSQQARGILDTAGAIYNYDYSVNYYAILDIIQSLPMPTIALLLLALVMIIFYASTFDVLTYVISGYSYKNLPPDKEPGRLVRIFWAAVIIILPIGLIFGVDALNSLQSVAIIAAFPIGIIVTLIVISFFKDVSSHYKNKGDGKNE